MSKYRDAPNSRPNSRVLVISDLHAPFCHPHWLEFLKQIKEKYRPDRVILTGDEIDAHTTSFHQSNTEIGYSPSSELEKSIYMLSGLYDLFKKADVLDSNHGSLYLRRAQASFLPEQVLKPPKQILNAPRGWNWHNSLTIKFSNGRRCFFTHGMSSNILLASQRLGMSLVQGHYHTKFSLSYWGNNEETHFALQLPCMIDDKSRAFSYNKNSPLRPLLGHAIILHGEPHLLPMNLNKKGEWNGIVP